MDAPWESCPETTRVPESETTTQATRRPDVTVPDVPPGDPASAYSITALDAGYAVEHSGSRARYRLDVEPVVRGRVDRDTGAVVLPVDDVEPIGTRALIREAIDDGDGYLVTASCALRRTIDRVDYFTTDSPPDVGYEATLVPLDPDSLSVRFDVELLDDDATADSPGAFELSVTNDGAEVVRPFAGTVPPFGTVYAERTDGERLLLWRAYEEEGCYRFTEDSATACSIGWKGKLEPGETIARRYELRVDAERSFHGRTDPPGTGAYHAEGSLAISREGADTGRTLRYGFAFGLE